MVVLARLERGVAMPAEPLGRGYARVLIERAPGLYGRLAYTLGAQATLRLLPDGIASRIMVPLGQHGGD